MDTIAFWVLHIFVGLLGFVLSAISARATVTVFFVLLIELFSLIGMSLPGGTDIAFILKMFGIFGLVFGVPISIGREKLAWWSLPLLAGLVLLLLRLPFLFDESAPIAGRAILRTLIAAVALAGGMLIGRGLVMLAARMLGRKR